MTRTDAQIAADLMLVHYEGEIAEKKAVSFSVNVERTGSQKDLDDAMDKFRKAVERQRKFQAIENCQKDIWVNEAEIARINTEIGQAQAAAAERMKQDNPLRKGKYSGMTAQQEESLRQQIASANEKLAMVDKLKSYLSQMRREVGEPDDGMKQAAE